MRSAFTTGIWLATFDTKAELTDYVNWKYSGNEDDPTCTFADDIGLEHFDNDFLESVFVETPFTLLAQIDNISFFENFKAQLLTAITNINFERFIFTTGASHGLVYNCNFLLYNDSQTN